MIKEKGKFFFPLMYGWGLHILFNVLLETWYCSEMINKISISNSKIIYFYTFSFKRENCAFRNIWELKLNRNFDLFHIIRRNFPRTGIYDNENSIDSKCWSNKEISLTKSCFSFEILKENLFSHDQKSTLAIIIFPLHILCDRQKKKKKGVLSLI